MNKRSKSLSLVLMGSLTVGLGGCASDDPGEQFTTYGSVDECVKEQVFSPQECRDFAVAAVQQNPAFTSQAECEQEFGTGNCKDAPSDSQVTQGGERQSSWMPLIAGYMVGRYLGGGGYMQGAQPLYQAPQQPGQQMGQQPGTAGSRASGGFARSYRTLGGGSIQTDAAGKVANPGQSVRQGFSRTAKPYVARTGAGSRGGFFGSKGFGSAGS